MWLIVGLGNPGGKYAGTRHNIGQIVVESFAEQLGVSFRPHSYSHQAIGRIGDSQVLLALPQTWMNESGLAVNELVMDNQTSPTQLIVVHDDLDLDFGVIRVKSRGGAGGHNGIRSVLTCIGTEQFQRLKVGIGRPVSGIETIQHVLSTFTAQEVLAMDAVLSQSRNALECMILEGSAAAMNRFHQKSKKAEGEAQREEGAD